MKLEFGGEGVPRAGGHDGCVGEERVRRMEEGGGQFGISLQMEGEGMNSVPSTCDANCEPGSPSTGRSPTSFQLTRTVMVLGSATCGKLSSCSPRQIPVVVLKDGFDLIDSDRRLPSSLPGPRATIGCLSSGKISHPT